MDAAPTPPASRFRLPPRPWEASTRTEKRVWWLLFGVAVLNAAIAYAIPPAALLNGTYASERSHYGACQRRTLAAADRSTGLFFGYADEYQS